MLYFIGIMIAKLIAAFVFVYILYFLSFVDNRVLLANIYNDTNDLKVTPLFILIILSFCIFVGNFL